MTRPLEPPLATCPYCLKRYLYTRSEEENGICNPCADHQYEQHQQRQEFLYYHGGEDGKAQN